MKNMTGITISEMAKELGIDKNAVLQRLFVAKIKPITKEALYDNSALEVIRNVPGKGRPKKIEAETKTNKSEKKPAKPKNEKNRRQRLSR
jgi:predicted ArsR family transcriptional regulator